MEKTPSSPDATRRKNLFQWSKVQPDLKTLQQLREWRELLQLQVAEDEKETYRNPSIKIQNFIRAIAKFARTRKQSGLKY